MSTESSKHLFHGDIRFKEIRVGLLSFIAVTLLIIAIVMVGGGSDIWEEKSIIRIRLSSVEGVKPGSPVMIGGIQAGKVKKMDFVPEKESFMAEVTLEILKSRIKAIRQDSVASIKSLGLLGDRYIEISLGSVDLPEIKSGNTLKFEKGVTIDDLTLQTATLTKNLSSLSNELEQTIENINQGKGTLGKLADDPDLYERTTSLVSEIEGLVKSIKEKPRKYFKFSLF